MTKLVNKVLFINNRRTSMRLCLTEWKLVDEICKNEHIARNDFIELIENSNSSGLGLTYYTRLFVMLYFYNKSPLGRIKTRRHGIGCQSLSAKSSPKCLLPTPPEQKLPAGCTKSLKKSAGPL